MNKIQWGKEEEEEEETKNSAVSSNISFKKKPE